MKKLLSPWRLLALLAVLTLGGCATLDPGADPVVVRAEQTIEIARVTLDAFVRYEYEHREALLKIDPAIKQAADTVRRQAPDILRAAIRLKQSYKLNRTADNKAGLAAGLATLDTAAAVAGKYLAELNPRTP